MPLCSEQELLSIFSAGRPQNLLPFTDGKREEILHNPLLQDYLANVRAVFDEVKGQSIPSVPFKALENYKRIGDRTAYSKYYGTHRRRLTVAFLMAWLYGEPEHFAYLEDIIWAVCDEYTWAVNAHFDLDNLENDAYTVDLYAAETACTLSEGLALVGDKLSPIVVKRAQYLIEERVLSRFEEQEWHWEHADNNWAAVCGGAVGIAAMYRIRDPKRLAHIVYRLFTAMDSYIASFPEDGSSEEGVSYWFYGFGFFASYAEMLCRYTNGKVDFFAIPKLHEIATFPHKCFFKGDNMVNFSDSIFTETVRWWGLLSFLHTLYPDVKPMPRPLQPDYDFDGGYRWEYILRDLVWGDDQFLPPQAATESYYLPIAQWMLCNSKDGNVSLAAKAGHNGVSHNHNDIGSFEYLKNGEELLADLGAGVYDGKSFGSDRYTLFWNASEGHSVPLVNGRQQLPGKQYAAKNVTCTGTVLTADIAGAYDDPTLSSFVRVHAFDDVTGVLTVTDSFAFTQPPQSLIERFVTRCEPVIEDGKITLAGENAACVLTYDAANWVPSVSSRPFLGHGSSKAHLPPKTVYFLDFTAVRPQAVASVCFIIQ